VVNVTAVSGFDAGKENAVSRENESADRTSADGLELDLALV
jgi:hypothetical protein